MDHLLFSKARNHSFYSADIAISAKTAGVLNTKVSNNNNFVSETSMILNSLSDQKPRRDREGM